jgi:hypothetical protein
MACLVGGIAFRQVSPRSTGAEHPKDTVEDAAATLPGTPAPVLAARWLGDESIKHGPLEIRQVSNVEIRHKTRSRQIVMELFKAKPCARNRKDDALVHLQHYRVRIPD